MIISGTNALVTGANRGLGAELVEGLLARGAGTVYAAVRDPRNLTHPAVKDPRVVPVHLDVTDLASVRAAAERAGDVDVLVNNAGIAASGSLLTGDPEHARAAMETNFWGPVSVLRAFAPVLARRGGGTAVTVLSALSWAAMPGAGAYAATKAAAWSLTNTAWTPTWSPPSTSRRSTRGPSPTASSTRSPPTRRRCSSTPRAGRSRRRWPVRRRASRSDARGHPASAASSSARVGWAMAAPPRARAARVAATTSGSV
jgi:NAD(P)-dependent dehydrogenase (short-subunit alcohol dehydrogenase family)